MIGRSVRLPASGIRQEEFHRFNTEACSPISNYNITGSPNMNTLLSFALVLAWSLTLTAQERTRRPIRPTSFHVEEKTIAQIHAALRSRQVTCRGLVEAYLARINAYDQKGPSLNAVVLLNPDALQTADELDARMKSGAAMRPLECIPVVVKDNYETKALRTTAGSQSLAKFIPTRDAFVVRKIREAGAIIRSEEHTS